MLFTYPDELDWRKNWPVGILTLFQRTGEPLRLPFQTLKNF